MTSRRDFLKTAAAATAGGLVAAGGCVPAGPRGAPSMGAGRAASGAWPLPELPPMPALPPRRPPQRARIVTVRIRSSFGYFASRNLFASRYSRVVLARAIGRSP